MENSTLLNLPEAIIEMITTFLDFRDLKCLTQTCKYLNEIAWRSLGEITEIHLSKILSYDDISAFRSSNRKYENVKLSTYNSINDVTLIKNILKQVSSIPSINLYNLTLRFHSRDISEEMHRVLQLYANDFKTITLDIDVKDSCCGVKADQIRSFFPKAMFTFIPYFSPTSPVNFDDVNLALSEPQEVLFRNNFQKVSFNNNISNVETITLCCDLKSGLEHFKNIHDFEIDGKLDLKSLEIAILNNKATLERLKVTQIEGTWLFKFPCQMKELTCWFSEVEDSSCYAEILSDQRNLRYFFLNYTKLTDNLCDVLSKNKLLTTIEFSYCAEEGLDLSKLEFLNNISEISFTDVILQDLSFVNAIIDNSRKVNRLFIEVDMLDEDPNEMLDLEPTVLENLQILQINGIDISNFISKRIKAPNLEVCNIDCDPEFLLECKRLRTLNLIAVELDHDQVVNILTALQRLETFYFIVKKEDFDKTFKYILKNLNNIKHFRLDLFAKDSTIVIDTVKIIESALKDSEITWTKLMSHYQTENFSFEIC